MFFCCQFFLSRPGAPKNLSPLAKLAVDNLRFLKKCQRTALSCYVDGGSAWKYRAIEGEVG